MDKHSFFNLRGEPFCLVTVSQTTWRTGSRGVKLVSTVFIGLVNGGGGVRPLRKLTQCLLKGKNFPSTSTQRVFSWSRRGSTRLAAPASESWLAKPCTSLSSSFFCSNSEPISYWAKSTRESLWRLLASTVRGAFDYFNTLNHEENINTDKKKWTFCHIFSTHTLSPTKTQCGKNKTTSTFVLLCWNQPTNT